MKKMCIGFIVTALFLQSCDFIDGIFNPIDPDAVYASISAEEFSISASSGTAELTLTNDCPYEFRIKIYDLPDWLTVNSESDFDFYEIVAPGDSFVLNFDLNLFEAGSTGVKTESFEIVYINESKYQTNDFTWGTDRKTFSIQASANIKNSIEITGFPVDWEGSSCEINIEIDGDGADQIDWEIVADEDWLSIEPQSGSGSITITMTAIATEELRIGNNTIWCDIITDGGTKTKKVTKEITSSGNWVAYIPGLKATNAIYFLQSNGNVYVRYLNWDGVSQTYSGSYPSDEIDSMGEFSISLSVPTFSYFYFSGDFSSVLSGNGDSRSSSGDYGLVLENTL